LKLSSNTILITGGGSGIGLALAERLLAAGNDVIICGRRAEVLEQASQRNPGLHTRQCDLASADSRAGLIEWAVAEFPSLNVLVNNAGIQQRQGLDLLADWPLAQQEIAINLEAPIHLTGLLMPHLAARSNAAIVNVTSGLAFAPLAGVPIYCATKAALHSFTLSLRHAAAASGIEVIEVIPPAVDTDLGGPGLHTFGVPLDEFADAVMAGLDAGATEIAYGSARQSSQASRDELDAMFQRMNNRH
jgi:uncharacterized oxidoreductase